MKPQATDSGRELNRTEKARIGAAYARRHGDARYSWFNHGHLFIIQRLESRLLNVLRDNGCAELQSQSVLEIGCGTGHWLREFVKWGVRAENVTGIDILADRLKVARTLCPPAVRLQCANAAELPFPDARFDIVLQSTVFTSILDMELKRRVAAEMMRVVKDDGLVLWYDYHVNIGSAVGAPSCPVFTCRLLFAGETAAAVYPLSRRYPENELRNSSSKMM
jgi:SAM-dependent methyltransferase